MLRYTSSQGRKFVIKLLFMRYQEREKEREGVRELGYRKP